MRLLAFCCLWHLVSSWIGGVVTNVAGSAWRERSNYGKDEACAALVAVHDFEYGDRE